MIYERPGGMFLKRNEMAIPGVGLNREGAGRRGIRKVGCVPANSRKSARAALDRVLTARQRPNVVREEQYPNERGAKRPVKVQKTPAADCAARHRANGNAVDGGWPATNRSRDSTGQSLPETGRWGCPKLSDDAKRVTKRRRRPPTAQRRKTIAVPRRRVVSRSSPQVMSPHCSRA